jgi:hypothetical protein
MSISDRDLPRVMTIYVSIIFALMFLSSSLLRLYYPYELDAVEGNMVMEAWQFARNLPVFVAPNADFIPQPGTPLYPWIGGLLLRLTGPDPMLLRVVSLLSTGVSASLIYFIARREGGEQWIAIASAGLFIGGYRVTGLWYDLAQVDSMFIALSLAGITIAIYSRGNGKLMLASGVLLALAFFTKPNALLFGFGVAIYLLFSDGRRAIWYLIPFLGAVVILVYILNSSTQGWFWFYAIALTSNDPFEAGRFANFFPLELFGGMIGPAGCLVASLYVAVRAASRVRFRHLVTDRPWLYMILTGVLTSWIARASSGSTLNDLMPAYTLLCIAPALLLREWSATLDAFSAAPVTIGTVELMVALSVLFQFSVGAYNPLHYVPTVETKANGDQFINRIRTIEGDVNVMMHPYYALRAGKQPSAQLGTVWYTHKRGNLPLPEDLIARLNSKFYSALITDEDLSESEPEVAHLIDENYLLPEKLDYNFSPPSLTGLDQHPSFLYFRKP